MTTIFPKALSIDACENIIKSINESAGDEALMLPVDTSKFAFGGLATAIQAINTWARISTSRKLIIRESSDKEEDRINEIVKRPHKFSAAMFAKEILDSSEGQADLRTKVNLAAKNSIENQAKSLYGQQHGRLCWFAFVDHSTKGFDRNFYIEKPEAKPEPRQAAQIQSIIRSMVEKSSLVAGGGKPLSDQDVDHLGRIFYELFLNTHEHGSRGKVRSEWIKPGIRIVYTNGINMPEDSVEGTIRGEPVLTNYLTAQELNLGNRSRFIEISILDSGLGYCGRWLADHPEIGDLGQVTLSQEYSIFKKCFSFRQTSSGQENKGNGLPVVMDRLTKLRGFMRIRSGRLALFRNFIESPYISEDSCDFSDWNSHALASKNLTEMAPATGVAITLLIPLEAKQ